MMFLILSLILAFNYVILFNFASAVHYLDYFGWFSMIAV
jgi:hypothetical protein